MRTSTMVWVVVIILIVLAGGWYFWSAQSAAPYTPAPSDQTQTTPATDTQGTTTDTQGAGTTSSAPMSATVTYGPNGFSPSSVTIAKGGTVTFAAAPGADEMWIASDPHPVHDGYDGTTRAQHCAAGYTGPEPFDQCAAGQSFSFTFNKTGSWGYHNHGNPSDIGTVVVQ